MNTIDELETASHWINAIINPRRVIEATLVATILSSCGVASNHSKDFQCEAVLGSPCTTIAGADGQGGSSVSNVVPVNGNTAVSPKPRTSSRGLFYNGKGSSGGGITNPEWPNNGSSRNLPSSRYDVGSQRIPERLGTLWVASYLDGDNVLHDASFVHFVITEAGWAGVH